jgi:hypothetical protein
MSELLCVWAADTPASSEQWYENEHIPQMISDSSHGAVFGEWIEIPLEKELERGAFTDVPCKWFTLYEQSDPKIIIDEIQSQVNLTSQPVLIQDATFDIRSYEELNKYQDKNWEGGWSTPP